MSNFKTSTEKLPGLNYNAPIPPNELEFEDDVMSDEIRYRTQLVSNSGIIDTVNPNSASAGSGRPLVVQPNSGDELKIDLIEGVCTTQAGNVINVDERVLRVPLATTSRDIPCVVLLEYVTIDDEESNVVNEYNETVAVKRILAPIFDPNEFDPNATNIDDLQNASSNMLKVVTLQTYNDLSKFSLDRKNDTVALAVVTIIADPSDSTQSILSIDMTNNVNTFVRPWFTPKDTEHRSFIGTGTVTSTNPHGTSTNELVVGNITLMQQFAQTGTVLSRDLDVPGCAGQLCQELIDSSRVFTDDLSGTITGVPSARYVRLASYPHRLLGMRENMLSGSEIVEDKSVSAKVISGAIVTSTNIVVLGRTSGQNDVFDSTLGFTIYYTAAEASRPPALPNGLSQIQNNTIQFQNPSSNELVLTGGKEYSALSSTSLAMGTAGPIPLRYKVWLDGSEQYLASPQVLFCAKLVEGSSGIGTASQTPQYTMYGNSRIRLGLWEAPEPVQSSMFVTIELTGKDVDGETITESLTIAGSSVAASPKSVAWNPPTDVFQVSEQIFSELTSFRVTDKFGLGSDAHVMLWAELEPTTTHELDDSLAVAMVDWNGLGIEKIWDIRNIVSQFSEIDVAQNKGANLGMQASTGIESAFTYMNVCNEDLKRPKYQDVILSKRVRNNQYLKSVMDMEILPSFETDGTAEAQEWYYSQAIRMPSLVQTGSAKLFVILDKEEQDPIFQTLESQAVVQLQYISVSGGSSTYSAWATLASQGSNDSLRVANINVNQAPAGTPYFKVRLRILAKNLRGYSLVMRQGT